MFTIDNSGVFRSESFSRIPGLVHGFGTRISVAWPGARPLAAVRQIHSADVVVVDAAGEYGQADALLTNQPGFLISIRTADCVPALIVDPATHTVAAVHAGWRGTAAEILPKTLDKMSRHFGTRIADVLVAIGPAIGQCCFEVGPEVAAQFQRWFPERTDLTEKTKIDLRETNLRQLITAGVPPDAVAIAGDECTRCNAERFHSWRRDAERAGRMVSAIGWEH
jgi:YfiH family protein